MRKYFISTAFVAYALLLFIPAQAWAGTISGTITAKGLRSPANILVYLAKGPSVSVDITATQFVMDQQDLTFSPHVLPVLVGSTVNFPNNDKVNHNVFSLSRTQKFNLGSYKSGESKTVLFDKPGIVEVRCDVHAEMLAYILVMKSPFWAVTDARGRFEIPDSKSLEQNNIKGITGLPAGKYVIKTWHEKLKTHKKSALVPTDGQVSVRLNIKRGVPGVLYK